MGIHERKARAKENLRQEILDAARELFVSEGFENISMRKIAEKIEYSPTTIYLHFQDKADLLHCICEETFAKLKATLEKIKAKPSDPLENLKEGCRAYIQFGLKNPAHYRVTFMMPMTALGEVKGNEFAGSVGQQAFSFLITNISAAIAAKQLREIDVELASQTVWAALHGLTSLLITMADFPWVKRKLLIENLVETILNGLR